MDCIVGVDGGNTKTIAFVVGLDGRILGVGRGGNSDLYAYPSSDGSVSVIESAVQQALDQAGCTRPDILSGGYSLAGADWPEDYDDFKRELAARGLGKTITVYNDAIGALRAGSPDGTGVVIACGTGGAMGARNASGDFWHTSYWQDSMCGREIGYLAIRAVRHADIGIEPPTALTAHLLKFFGVDSVAGILRLFTMRPQHPPSGIQVSKLAPLVLTEAENGDAVAQRLIEDHGIRLADYALAAARKVGIEHTPFNLIFNGGIFRHPGTFLKTTILNRIRATSPDIVAYMNRFEPVVGAVMLGFEAIGIPITHALEEAMSETMPSKELFHT